MHRRMRRVAFATLAVVPMLAMAGTFVLLSNGDAQEADKTQAPAKMTQAAPAKNQEPASRPPPQVAMPEAEQIVLLTRTSLLTLNDALQTGNFTVLRDMAAPGFREANSAARLSAIFGNLMTLRLDLTAIAILAPQLTEAPVLDQTAGIVRIKGYFPVQPLRIDFEVVYQAVGGRWRLFGLSVQPGAPTPVAAVALRPADNPAEAQKKAAKK